MPECVHCWGEVLCRHWVMTGSQTRLKSWELWVAVRADRCTSLTYLMSAHFIIGHFFYVHFLSPYRFSQCARCRSPSLVNFGLADTFPSLPEYSGLLSPTVEIVGDMAHVWVIILNTTRLYTICHWCYPMLLYAQAPNDCVYCFESKELQRYHIRDWLCHGA